jgi:gluconolactonase
MTREVQRDPEPTISRRTLVHGGGSRRCHTGWGGALAQQGGQLGPPTTITTPPRDFGPHGAPTTYFWDPRRHRGRSVVNNLAQPNAAIKLVGRRPGLERARPLFRVERHPQ